MSLAALPMFAYAHSGRTDSNGGHHDYENQSGLGSYHYHHGYGPHLHPNGVCPYEGGSDYSSAASGSSGSSSSGSSSTSQSKKSLKITDKPDSSVKVGKTITLDTDSYGNITWKSSDDKIATVNSDGEVKAVGVGKVTITAALSDGTSDSFTLVVDPIKTETVTLISYPHKITIGKTSTLKAEISPENATDKTLTWKVSDESLAKITTNGEITGIGTGFLEITVGQGGYNR